MENAVDALKIAFAVMMFVMALTLSISSFSNASSAITSITSMRDRETEYTYVKPSENLTRVVGIETVVTSMYRSFGENIAVYFMEKDGTTPLVLYNDIDSNGEIREMSCIDLSNEGLQTIEELDIILSGESALEDKPQNVKDRYQQKIIHKKGLYEFLKGKKFEELLGEYYQGEGTTKIKKRIITYILQ